MQVSMVHNAPNFEARLRIKKEGFKNIARDLGDSVSVSNNTSGAISSSIGESTIFPLELVAGKGFANSIKTQFRKIGNNFKNIFCRNINTVAIENPENLKAFSKQSGSAAAGSSTVSSGIGSYAGSIGSALDQSVNYPFSVYDRSIPEYLNAHAPECVLKSLTGLTNSAYNSLYNERGFGNESASLISSMVSGVGVGAQGLGSANIVESTKKMSEILSKKIPS